MDEMGQDLRMPGDLKNADRLIRSVEAFHLSLALKRMVRLAERNCYGAGRHKQSGILGSNKQGGFGAGTGRQDGR